MKGGCIYSLSRINFLNLNFLVFAHGETLHKKEPMLFCKL